uniref:Interaction protein for cytohesin exchange factors 1 n=1 Tax=Astyanax mexicanus TaxID=7994 RepID=A0A8B9K6I5_ASTMX
MSRRRVSVKDLGKVDCQGWLYKKRENRGFLGHKWKKYWFVLKGSSVYWYTGDEKAEGYINLKDFTLDQAQEYYTVYYEWLSKLTEAASKQEPTDTAGEECYSEASDDEDEEQDSAETCAQDTEQLTTSSINVSSVSLHSLHSFIIHQTPPSDELEMLYFDLKHASLTPCGTLQPLSKRDYRSSFIRRCKNDTINEKLHLVRTLNSTLKAKEADLLTIEQVLADSALEASKYRLWRSANVLLMEEISHKFQTAEETLQTPQLIEPLQTPPQCSPPAIYAETSL